MSERPPIGRTPGPEYPEKYVPLHKIPTGEYDFRKVKRELERRDSLRWKAILGGIAGIIVALGTAGAAVVKALSAHDRADITEYRLGQGEKDVEELKKKVEHTQLRIVGCCGEGRK